MFEDLLSQSDLFSTYLSSTTTLSIAAFCLLPLSLSLGDQAQAIQCKHGVDDIKIFGMGSYFL